MTISITCIHRPWKKFALSCVSAVFTVALQNEISYTCDLILKCIASAVLTF